MLYLDPGTEAGEAEEVTSDATTRSPSIHPMGEGPTFAKPSLLQLSAIEVR